jgi:hypothetical protein
MNDELILAQNKVNLLAKGAKGRDVLVWQFRWLRGSATTFVHFSWCAGCRGFGSVSVLNVECRSRLPTDLLGAPRHRFGGSPGEGEQQDPPRISAAGDQLRDPMRYGATAHSGQSGRWQPGASARNLPQSGTDARPSSSSLTPTRLAAVPSLLR